MAGKPRKTLELLRENEVNNFCRLCGRSCKQSDIVTVIRCPIRVFEKRNTDDSGK